MEIVGVQWLNCCGASPLADADADEGCANDDGCGSVAGGTGGEASLASLTSLSGAVDRGDLLQRKITVSQQGWQMSM